MNKKNFKKIIYLKRTCKTRDLDHKTVIKFLYIKKIDELKQYLPKSNMNKKKVKFPANQKSKYKIRKKNQ